MTMILSKVQIAEKPGSSDWENPFQYILELKRGGFNDSQINEMLVNRGFENDRAARLIEGFHSQLELTWSARRINRQIKLFLLFVVVGFLITSILRLYTYTEELFFFSAVATILVVGIVELKRYFE